MSERDELEREQLKFYKASNFVLSPVHLILSLIGTACILLLLVGMGCFYPLEQYMSGNSFDSFWIVIPVLTVMAVFTLFYAPCYFVFSGIFCLLVFGMLVSDEHGFFFNWFDFGWHTASVVFIWLSIGITQRYVRRRIEKREDEEIKKLFEK